MSGEIRSHVVILVHYKFIIIVYFTGDESHLQSTAVPEDVKHTYIIADLSDIPERKEVNKRENAK